ncbi:hypothetical protein LTR56_009252 [Elasticomyces elasticus]|nr:hypothetical protein LTR56_009252 [Elasticomyces elasticus]KAK3664784.1 hypothetical protein LTR22_004372 [Elasticomyces elasticus]KAK4928594.1 hypothetical protein LTR49_004715 [Elasticomyces elasticus]KAK5765162.1 hypothetical protein LTS12_004674 [Elasticomyces elasticus]
MTEAVRWRAVASRDSNYDGIFVYCVKTTKIYCRPVCKARLARRSNVEFRDTAEDAESDGYRACKRCQPQSYCSSQPEAEKIRRICMVLDDLSADAPLPGLKTMAETAGLSRYHFHRQFKKVTGMTPREYALAARSAGSSSTATPSPAAPETTPNQDGNDWQGSGTWAYSDAEPFTTLTKMLSCKYVVVSTTYGLLLVVFCQQQLCKLELFTDHDEIKDSLERAFPTPTYSHDCINLEDDEYVFIYRQHIDAVVEALERPSGKMLEITLPVAC